MSKECDVGYGKPPVNHQFKKGKSGNPSGRPRKRPRFAPKKEPLDAQRALIAELKSSMMVVENGKKKKISRLEALIKSLVTDALQGDRSARKALLGVVEKLPKDAFVDNGNEVYTYRATAAQLKALEELVEQVANDEREFRAEFGLSDDSGPPSAP